MLRKFLIYFVVLPLAILFVLFAVANRQIITLSFDPFSTTQPALSFTMPFFVLIFILLIVGIVVGGVAVQLRQAQSRRRVRLLNADIVQLRREVETLNMQLEEKSHSNSGAETTRIPYLPTEL